MQNYICKFYLLHLQIVWIQQLAVPLTYKNIIAFSVLYTAVPSKVTGISVTNQFISTDGDDVTLVLSWNESSDNCYPILSYTVSCTSKSRCPVTVTVYNESSVNLTNLAPGVMYTFSVIATNIIGDGEPGTLNITTVSCELYRCLFSVYHMYI